MNSSVSDESDDGGLATGLIDRLELVDELVDDGLDGGDDKESANSFGLNAAFVTLSLT